MDIDTILNKVQLLKDHFAGNTESFESKFYDVELLQVVVGDKKYQIKDH